MVFDRSIKAIIFDFDGTLFHLNVAWDELKDALSEIGVASLYQIEKLNKDKLQLAIKILGDAELAGVNKGESAPYSREVLDSLNGQYNLAIVSRNLRSTIIEGVRRIGYTGNVEIIGREDVNRLKPDPSGFELAIKRLGISASEALIIGDTYHDVKAAKMLGVKVYIVQNLSLEFVPDGADKYLGSLSELIYNKEHL